MTMSKTTTATRTTEVKTWLQFILALLWFGMQPGLFSIDEPTFRSTMVARRGAHYLPRSLQEVPHEQLHVASTTLKC